MSTAKQDLDRQVNALRRAGIGPERTFIFLDKKSGEPSAPPPEELNETRSLVTEPARMLEVVAVRS